MKIGEIYKNRCGEDCEIEDTNGGSKTYPLLVRNMVTGEITSHTAEGYYFDEDSIDDRDLILTEEAVCDDVCNAVCDDVCNAVCDEELTVGDAVCEEEPDEVCDEVCEEEPDEVCEEEPDEVCYRETNPKDEAINEVINSIKEYQLCLNKLLGVSLYTGACLDEVDYITTLLKDSVELKETIRNI